MARVFITGSSDGLGLAGQLLARGGHEVTLHARNAARAEAARRALPQACDVVIGDVSTVAAMHSVAEQVNALGVTTQSSIMSRSAIASRTGSRLRTACRICSQSTCSRPMTALVAPRRLVYLSSGMRPGAARLL